MFNECKNDLPDENCPDNSSGNISAREKSAEFSFFAALWWLFCMIVFLVTGLCFAGLIYLLEPEQDIALIAAGIFLFSLSWQNRTATRSFFKPLFIFAMFIFLEMLVVGFLALQPGLERKIDLKEVRNIIKREAPEAYQFLLKLSGKTDQADRHGLPVNNSTLEAAKKAIEGFKKNDRQRRIIIGDEIPAGKPADFATGSEPTDFTTVVEIE
jgi:hypothetical protein